MTRRTCTQSCRRVEICLHLPAERCSRAVPCCFATRQNGIFTASLRRSIHFPLCRKAIECCFSAAKRLTTDAAIGDESKALILTAKEYLEIGWDLEYRFFEKRSSDPDSVLHIRDLNLHAHDGKDVRLTPKDGTQAEGVCEWLCEGFCDSKLGIPEEALQIDDTVYAVSEITALESVEL